MQQLDFIEEDDSLVQGVIVTSAKKSIFIAGADLKTLLRAGADRRDARDSSRRGNEFLIGSPL